MPPLTKRWQVSLPLTIEAGRALQDFHPVIRQILYNRGYSTSQAALRYLEAGALPDADPFAMTGVGQAVERIEAALRRSEPIAIYGDYDVDGVTATALLVEYLSSLGGEVRGYIPNRFDEGYGLNKEALDALRAEGIGLVITVDCGVRSLEEAEHARQIGLDLIITDHHHPGEELPAARAVIDPKQSGDLYPEKDLAGVGLAYKLALALRAYRERSGSPLPGELPCEDLLDLVALGTVADLVPLVGENRALVRAGLQAIRQPKRQGLLSLIGGAGLKPERVTASEISFILGPRLNAAGRLDSALAAFRLLTSRDLAEAGRLAQGLEAQNYERQKIMREIQASAERLALAVQAEPLILFAAHPDFNPGVVGLAASRLTEMYYRPAIVAHQGEVFTRASCRSIPEFHITEALDLCADLLEHYGGHAAAAGFTVRNERLPGLLERLNSIAAQMLSNRDLRPTLHADMEIQLKDLRADLLPYLDMLQPTGYGNPQAVFVSRGLQVKKSYPVGRDGAHLRLAVSDGWITFDAIAFRQGHWLAQMPERIDLMYTFERNEYNWRETLQLNVRDLKPAGVPD